VLLPVEDVETAPVCWLCYEAILDRHFGEIASCQAKIAEAIALAKKLNDMHGLAVALCYAVFLGQHERNPAEVERFALDLIELSTRQNFPYWLVVIGSIFRGWARSASGNTEEGISWIDEAIRDRRATGSILAMPSFLALKAEALSLRIISANPLRQLRRQKHWPIGMNSAIGVPNCTGFAVCFSRLYVPTRLKLRFRSAQPLEPQRSRSRFR
jgi:hypothetical protein